jgi:hypothetical protein
MHDDAAAAAAADSAINLCWNSNKEKAVLNLILRVFARKK